MGATSNKDNLTILVTGNAAGEMAPSLALYSFERIPTLMSAAAPPDWGIGRSKNGWMTCEAFYEHNANVFCPYLEKNQIPKPILLMLDGHKSHLSLPPSKLCQRNGIERTAFLPNATRIIQPLDVAFFAPLTKS